MEIKNSIINNEKVNSNKAPEEITEKYETMPAVDNEKFCAEVNGTKNGLRSGEETYGALCDKIIMEAEKTRRDYFKKLEWLRHDSIT